MKVVVLSDTHVPVVQPALPEIVMNELGNAGMCFHAGDFVEYSVFDELRKRLPVHAVCGNMDCARLKSELKVKLVLTIGKRVVGITHGKDLQGDVRAYMRGVFGSDYDGIDIFIYGHTHMPQNAAIDGKIFFNPGSPTDKVFAPSNSYGILTIIEESIEPKVVRIG